MVVMTEAVGSPEELGATDPLKEGFRRAKFYRTALHFSVMGEDSQHTIRMLSFNPRLTVYTKKRPKLLVTDCFN
jgi:hypothetical protein